MVYLITGGAGFIGSHLAERLLERGDQVLLMDNLSTGSMENIRHLKKYDRMHYFLEPLENRQLLAELVDEADVIFHLAAVVSAQAEADYELGRRVNLRGTDAVVDACRHLVATGRKPPRVVFTSSVASFSYLLFHRSGSHQHCLHMRRPPDPQLLSRKKGAQCNRSRLR